MKFDYQLFQLINNLAGKNHFIDHIIALYSQYSPLIFGGILIGLWFAYNSNKRNKQTVLFAVVAAGLGLAMNQMIIHFYSRPRPFSSHMVHLLLAKSSDPSFPSDHATGSFALALTVFYYNRKYGMGMLILAFILGLSRVYVGTHYPTDILGGILTGMFGSFLVIWQSKNLQPITNWIISTWNQIIGTYVKKRG